MLKQIFFAILGVVSVLFGLLCTLNLLYNLPDRGFPLGTDGKLAVALFVILPAGSFLSAYWLFKSAP
jgi:hypothetical protein